MDLPERTLEYIARWNLIGMSEEVARRRGNLSTKRNGCLKHIYHFESTHPGCPDDPRGAFVIDRCDWDGGALLRLREAGIERFLAIPLDDERTPTGPIVLHDNRRYQIETYEPGVWIQRLKREHDLVQ